MRMQRHEVATLSTIVKLALDKRQHEYGAVFQ